MPPSEKSTRKSKILRYLLKVLLMLLIVSIMTVVTPRVWSALNPDKPPVGYHFMAPAYFALWIGLEKLVNIAPQVPGSFLPAENDGIL